MGRVNVKTVSRVHDVGGQTGFGPVPAPGGDAAGGADAAPFSADWEARVFALSRVLRDRGVFNGDEFRDAIESLPPERYLAASYYERWLEAMEALLARKGIA
jgi:nitrile hydratase subunit beta